MQSSQSDNFTSSGGKTITTTKGGTPAEQKAVEDATARVLGTKRGQEMVKAVEARGSPVEVRINNSGRLKGDTSGGKYIEVDPGSHPLVRTTAGKIPATTDRIIAHELGHAVFGISDSGPGRMNNVNLNENPIMLELGEPARTHY